MSDTMQFWLDVRAGLLQIVDAIERLPEANVHPTTAELRRQVRRDYRVTKDTNGMHVVKEIIRLAE